MTVPAPSGSQVHAEPITLRSFFEARTSLSPAIVAFQRYLLAVCYERNWREQRAVASIMVRHSAFELCLLMSTDDTLKASEHGDCPLHRAAKKVVITTFFTVKRPY